MSAIDRINKLKKQRQNEASSDSQLEASLKIFLILEMNWQQKEK